MEFAWNVQKNKLSDVKGKEMEQDRKGKIRNDDIKLNKTHLNYDLVNDHRSLYNRVKDRVNDVKDNSRIRKDSVVMCSNVVTVNKETATKWGSDKVERYFKETYNYFCNEFGKENVVSAKVHLDETTPHMHLHFVPISDEGKLQCKKILTRNRINKIHTNAPKFLLEKGFEIERGSGETGKKNIKDIHRFKAEKLENQINEKQQELNQLLAQIHNSKYALDKLKYSSDLANSNLNFDLSSIKIESVLLDKNKIKIDKSQFETLICNYKKIFNENIEFSKENATLKLENSNLNYNISSFEEDKKLVDNLKKSLLKKDNEKDMRIKELEKDIDDLGDMLTTYKEYYSDLKNKFDDYEKLLKEYNIFDKVNEKEYYFSDKKFTQTNSLNIDDYSIER